jgi:hypothetical protein
MSSSEDEEEDEDDDDDMSDFIVDDTTIGPNGEVVTPMGAVYNFVRGGERRRDTLRALREEFVQFRRGVASVFQRAVDNNATMHFRSIPRHKARCQCCTLPRMLSIEATIDNDEKTFKDLNIGCDCHEKLEILQELRILMGELADGDDDEDEQTPRDLVRRKEALVDRIEDHHSKYRVD